MYDTCAASIIVNDLDSMVHRVEALPLQTSLTEASQLVLAAKQAVLTAQLDLHHQAMQARRD